MLNKFFSLNILLFLSILKLYAQQDAFKMQCHGRVQNIVIDSVYEKNTELFVFEDVNYIDGLSVTMDVAILSSDFLIRVILEDMKGHQYLVAESYKELSQKRTQSFVDYCEETALINDVRPSKLKLVVHNASISMHSVSVMKSSTLQRGGQKMESAVKIMRESQIHTKVNEINAYNETHNKLWYAALTPLALMTYDERMKILGISDECETGGIEYYAGGIFEYEDFLFAPQSKSSDGYIEEFDWRERHGQNWMTSVKNQHTAPYCTAFAVIAGVEALANLYYNQKIDYNLSEQEIACCAKFNPNPQVKCGVNPDSALIYVRDNGVMLEQDYPFSPTALQICESDDKTPTDIIRIAGYATDITQTSISTALIKQTLIQKGPLVSWIHAKNFNHAMLLVGYGQIKEGMVLKNYQPHINSTTITISADDPRIGMTYWKFKNSWGLTSSNGTESGIYDGYMYILMDTLSIIHKMYSISVPMTTVHYTNASILCEDSDGDGFYNWGIGTKPAHCPSWVPDTPDGDDSDYAKGPMNEYGYLADIPSMIPDSTIYITQDTEWNIRKYVYHNVYVDVGKTLRITNDINFYRGVTLNLAAGSTLIVDGGSLTDVVINYTGTTGTSIQLLNNGTINYLNNQDFVVPLGVSLEFNYGKID